MEINITLNFDMDGTLADLYGVEGWLDSLLAEDTAPYELAAPLLRMSALAKRLNNLQRQGYRLAIISWTSKNGSKEYNERVEAVKREWLAKHLPSVHWDEIIIAPYGTPKNLFSHTAWDVLFDDEKQNREDWMGEAFDAQDILAALQNL